MGIKGSNGFTIIEVMLFLGVSGLMIFGILAGTGTAINQQRYRDSVNSLAMRLQQQYADVAGVQNDRAANWDCSSSTGGPVDKGVTPGVPRGASDCVILGKYITGTDQIVTTQAVIGLAVASNDKADDITALQKMQPTASGIQLETYPLEWNARMVKLGAGNTASATFSMLVVRSPVSGSVRTFVNAGSISTPLALLTKINLLSGISFCVDSNGLFTGPRQEIIILPNSSSASGVTVNATGTAQC